MALTANFYSFSKRQNSTKVPTGIAGTSFNVVLKNPTSMNAPVLTLNADTFPYNYCSFNGAYYFVTDTVSVRNDIWEIHLTKDVMGTYRAEILASTAYVLYDTTANTKIVDSRLALECNYTTDYADTEITQLDGPGKYALTVVGTNSTDTFILADTFNLTNLFISVFASDIQNADPGAPSISDPFGALSAYTNLKWFWDVFKNWVASGNAPEAIQSCLWLPWNVDGDDPNGATEIHLGGYETGIYATRTGVVSNTVLFTYSVSIPWLVNDWRRLSPYTQVYLYLPFVGLVNIPSASICDYTALTVEYSLAKRSGEVSVIVSADNGMHILGTYAAQTAVVVPIGRSSSTPLEKSVAVLQAAGAGASIATGGGLPGAAALTGLVGNLSTLMAGVPSCIGGNSGGSDAGLPRYIRCITVLHDTVVSPSSVASTIGTPAFEPKSLGSLTGYVQTHEFSLQAAAPDQDLQRINTYLNGGAFIE